MVIGRKSYQLWICRCDHRTTESRSNQCNRTELTPEMMAQARAEKDKKEKRMKEIQNMLDFYG